MAGRALEDCRQLVNHNRRLFHYAIRLAGWNHALGNTMKKVAKSYLWWPEVLDHIRVLTRFYRNQSWREWITRAVGDRRPNTENDLQHFTAGTAKWRFETIVEAEKQLVPLRDLCENYVKEEFFTNAQEKMFINDVLKACKDTRLWLFIVLTYTWVFQGLEHIRRWGLICPHEKCNERRKKGEHVTCPQNGHRLPQAWDWLQLRIADFKKWSTSVTPADCENSIEWCGIIRQMCATCASLLKSSFKYLGTVPWLFLRPRIL